MTSSALEFLLTRRSHPAKTLAAPAPGPDEVRTLLTAASRSPDHGKLEPWRFIVLQKPALARLAQLIGQIGTDEGRAEDQIEKQRRQYADADLAVAVIYSPRASEKIPEIEQLLSAGAVCLSLLNAALASGWGANWLTGWAIYDGRFRAEALRLADSEQVAGMIHIGTRTLDVQDRPRPDVDAITTWVAE